jgi:hypothetical protein
LRRRKVDCREHFLRACATYATARRCVPPGFPPGEPTAWEKILATTPQDGSWTVDQARAAFALLVAPLPGVTPPAGGGEASPAAEQHDAGALGGCAAINGMLGHWAELTEDERRRVFDAISGGTPLALSFGGPIARASGDSVLQLVTPLLRDARDAIARRLGVDFQQAFKVSVQPLGVADDGSPVRAKVVPQSAEEGDADSFGTFHMDPDPGPVAWCSMVVSPTFVDLNEASRAFVITHEVFHCFQAQVTGLKQHRQAPALILESSADWAAADIVGVADVSESHWRQWFETPYGSIVDPRTPYRAVGLFAEVAYLGEPVWRRMDGFLHTTAIDAAIRWLAIPVEVRLRRSWASSTVREPARGREWDVAGMGVPAFRTTPTEVELSEGRSLQLNVLPWAAEVFRVNLPSPVIQLSMHGEVRIADAKGLDRYDEYVRTSLLCTKPPCECPDGTPLPVSVVKVQNPVLLALTGWETGAGGLIAAPSLGSLCHRNETTTSTSTSSTSTSLDPGVDHDGDGFTGAQGDCDDQNSSVHPGAVERPGDSHDQDCNPVNDRDGNWCGLGTDHPPAYDSPAPCGYRDCECEACMCYCFLPPDGGPRGECTSYVDGQLACLFEDWLVCEFLGDGQFGRVFP